jgi:hypothetical protein
MNRYHVNLRYMVGSRAERTLRMDRLESHYFPTPQSVRAFLVDIISNPSIKVRVYNTYLNMDETWFFTGVHDAIVREGM